MRQMPTRRHDLLIQDVGGEAVLYDRRDGQTHALDAVASSVLSLCDGAKPVEEAATQLGLSPLQVEATLDALHDADLLVAARGATRRNLLTGAGVVGAGLVLATVRAPMAFASVSGSSGGTGGGAYTPSTYDAYTELNAASGTPAAHYSFASLSTSGGSAAYVTKTYSTHTGASGSVKYVSAGSGGSDFLGGTGYPVLFVNPSATTTYTYSSVTLPASRFAVHPDNGVSAVVTFTVPAGVPAGSTATISYSVSDADAHGNDGIAYSLGTSPGGGDLKASTSLADGGSSGPLTATTTVSAGSTISVTIDPKLNHGNDSTALTFSVSV